MMGAIVPIIDSKEPQTDVTKILIPQLLDGYLVDTNLRGFAIWGPFYK